MNPCLVQQLPWAPVSTRCLFNHFYDLYTKLICVHSNIFQLVWFTKYFKFAPTYNQQYSRPSVGDVLYNLVTTCPLRPRVTNSVNGRVKICIITTLRGINWIQTLREIFGALLSPATVSFPSGGHNVNLPDPFQLFSRIPQRFHNDFLRLNCQRFLVSSCPTTTCLCLLGKYNWALVGRLIVIISEMLRIFY